MTKQIPYYYRHLNQKLLDELPDGLGRVLEFGCSAGVLGKAYKNNNKETVWHGVEINSEAIEIAKKNLDRVWSLDANMFEPVPEMLEQPYDAIIYGDVIEHLIDPIVSLPSHLKLLDDEGELIVCLPNVQHWTIVKDLLQGNWDYKNAGLMDNTHLRFFTRKSIYKLLSKLKMKLIKQVRISHENAAFKKRVPEKDEIIEVLNLANQSLGIEFNELDFRTFQYIIRAVKD